jgi:RNA polymerase sigma-70 factor (ECF subfamily)
VPRHDRVISLTPPAAAVDTLARARDGDHEAFADLVREHQALVFGLAWRFLRRRGDAEELAQDVFVALHQNLTKIESPAHLVAWLRQVTSRRCIDHARRRWWRLERGGDRLPEPHTSGGAADPLLSATIRRLVGTLSPDARMVVILRFQEDLDPAEIADVLAMPVNTVKSHLRRSLDAMRAKLAPMVGECDEA